MTPRATNRATNRVGRPGSVARRPRFTGAAGSRWQGVGLKKGERCGERSCERVPADGS